MREHGNALAREAHEETGLGRYEDKIIKNQLVTEKTPGTEDLQPHAVTGDDGLNLTEPAPYGVIAAITPTTNPTSTIINNTIGMVAAGNAVVFNVHPNAKRVSCHNVALLNKAVVAVGLAYATQESPAVPATPRDARLDFVLTEREVIDCRRA